MSGGGRISCGVSLLMILMMAGGCKVGPDYHAPKTDVPAEWSEKTPGVAATQPAADARWWKTFNDPVLDSLVDKAVLSNLNLKIAASRIREARALRRIVISGEWPSVSGSGAYQRSKGSENTSISSLGAFGTSGAAGGGMANPMNQFFTDAHDLWQLGFDASWEIDVFGGVRRAIEAADADVEASVESRRDVLVSLLAELVANYVDLRGIQRQVEVTRNNIRSQQESVDLTRTRFQAGLTGELDVARAEAQVATTAATLPILEASARRAIHRIGVLAGQPPGSLLEQLSKVSPMPAMPPAVPVGLPSDLLRRRADIRQAERQIAAATARIGVATADLFPKFSLTGGIGLQSNKAKTLFNSSSNFWSIGPGVALPIFDRGKIRARINVEDERTAQALNRYEYTVLLALEEVENAMVAYSREQSRRKSLADAVKANRRAVELANELYTRGLSGFLDVLDAQRALYLSEEQLIISERNVATDLVALYKALGGGWEQETLPQDDSQADRADAVKVE